MRLEDGPKKDISVPDGVTSWFAGCHLAYLSGNKTLKVISHEESIETTKFLFVPGKTMDVIVHENGEAHALIEGTFRPLLLASLISPVCGAHMVFDKLLIIVGEAQAFVYDLQGSQEKKRLLFSIKVAPRAHTATHSHFFYAWTPRALYKTDLFIEPTSYTETPPMYTVLLEPGLSTGAQIQVVKNNVMIAVEKDNVVAYDAAGQLFFTWPHSNDFQVVGNLVGTACGFFSDDKLLYIKNHMFKVASVLQRNRQNVVVYDGSPYMYSGNDLINLNSETTGRVPRLFATEDTLYVVDGKDLVIRYVPQESRNISAYSLGASIWIGSNINERLSKPFVYQTGDQTMVWRFVGSGRLQLHIVEPRGLGPAIQGYSLSLAIFDGLGDFTWKATQGYVFLQAKKYVHIFCAQSGSLVSIYEIQGDHNLHDVGSYLQGKGRAIWLTFVISGTQAIIQVWHIQPTGACNVVGPSELPSYTQTFCSNSGSLYCRTASGKLAVIHPPVALSGVFHMSVYSEHVDALADENGKVFCVTENGGFTLNECLANPDGMIVLVPVEKNVPITNVSGLHISGKTVVITGSTGYAWKRNGGTDWKSHETKTEILGALLGSVQVDPESRTIIIHGKTELWNADEPEKTFKIPYQTLENTLIVAPRQLAQGVCLKAAEIGLTQRTEGFVAMFVV
jgi:hypothetical protein